MVSADMLVCLNVRILWNHAPPSLHSTVPIHLFHQLQFQIFLHLHGDLSVDRLLPNMPVHDG